jgi:hypothetical protein
MKFKVLIPVFLLLSGSVLSQINNETPKEKEERMAWWTEARFGTLIQLYSVTGTLVIDHSYNGVSLDLSHFNKGLYLMNVEGFKAKKIIKQ